VPSFRRKPESRFVRLSWTPAFAGVTALARAISRAPTLSTRLSAQLNGYATGRILVDRRTWGVVRSKTGKYRLVHQRNDGLAVLLPREGLYEGLFGVERIAERPDSGVNTPELARPSCNVGYVQLKYGW
jgi:hypothetical protein